MKDWYGGRQVDPLDKMSREALQQMFADVKEAHQVATWTRDDAERTGRGLAAFEWGKERKRLASIGSDIRSRL